MVDGEISPVDSQRFLIMLYSEKLIRGKGNAIKHCQTSDKLGALLHLFCAAAKEAVG